MIKGEESFQEDELLEGGVKTGLHNGTNYTEVRKYTQDNTIIMFYFVTRCYGEYMQSILDDFKLEPPDVIIMNSCLWDLHRYGQRANAEYITNISELFDAIDLAVPHESSLLIWNATLPVRETVKAGFLPPGVDHTIPAEDIRKANLYVRDELKGYGKRFIFLDLHQIFYTHLDLRVKDGVHWNDFAHRKITCLILNEISKHWNFEIPSKSPLSPMPDDVIEQVPPVSNDIPVNANPRPIGAYPPPLFDVPPRSRNGFVTNGPEMNDPSRNFPGVRLNGTPGNFPRGPLGPPAIRPPRLPPSFDVPPGPRVRTSSPRSNGPPRLKSPSSRGFVPNIRPPRPMVNGSCELMGPRVNGRPSFRVKSPPVLPLPVVPRMRAEINIMGNNLGFKESIRSDLLGNAPIRNRPLIGPVGPRNRRGRTRSATHPVGPRPPRGWLSGPPRFLNNNEYLSPRFPLNDSFPPAFPGKRKFIEEDDFHRPYKFPRM